MILQVLVLKFIKNQVVGFWKGVYQEALKKEFTSKGIPFEKEKKIEIYYKYEPLEKYYMADFVCFNEVLLELKAL